MKKLVFKKDITDWDDGEREEHETNEDQLLIEAFKKRGYEIDQPAAYKVWLALSMDWDASWLMWQGDHDEIMTEYMKYVTVVE